MREVRGETKKHGKVPKKTKQKTLHSVAGSDETFSTDISSHQLFQYLLVLGPTETQSSSTLARLLLVLDDRARLGVGDALFHNPERLSLPLLGLLDQRVRHVQRSDMDPINRISKKKQKKHKDNVKKYLESCLLRQNKIDGYIDNITIDNRIHLSEEKNKMCLVPFQELKLKCLQLKK